jgi:hypothetical protein
MPYILYNIVYWRPNLYTYMKKLLSLYVLLTIHLAVAAQFKTIGEGPEFNEDEEGYAKVLQLTNGNTIYLHFSIRHGINVQMYDAAYKQISKKDIEPSYGKLRGGDFDGIFETKGDVTVLLSERTDRHPVLRRLTFDGKNGGLKKEEVLVDLDERKFRGKRYSDGSSSDFFLVKDPNSACFAVITSKNDPGWEIIHYGEDNKIVSRADLPDFQGDEIYFSYKDFVVMGDQRIYLLGYQGASSTKEKDRKTEMLLATLEKGGNAFQITRLKFPKDENIKGGLIRYNSVKNELIMLQAVERKVEKKYRNITFVSTYDLAKKEASAAKEVSLTKVEEKSKEVFGKKNDYKGIPQNLYIKPDGSYYILFEENEVEWLTDSKGRTRGFLTTLGDLAAIHYDPQGKETGCWMVPKRFIIPAMGFDLFYHKQREHTAEWMENANQFKFFNFLSSPTQDYILINDREENGDPEGRKVKALRSVSGCSGYLYKLGGKATIPERDTFFNGAGDDKEKNLGIFIIADYQAAKNSYVTIKTTKGKSRLVWMKPE